MMLLVTILSILAMLKIIKIYLKYHTSQKPFSNFLKAQKQMLNQANTLYKRLQH